MKEKQYKIVAPLGSIIVPKEYMTEKDVREFIPKIIQDPTHQKMWEEKAEKDEIEDLITLLQQAGYEVIID